MSDNLTKWGLPVNTLTEKELSSFVSGEPPEPLSDRRSSARRKYPCIRAVADCKSDKEAANAFYPVQCQDLSANGIGFFSPKRPATDSVVVRLSAEDEQPVLVRAKVVYCNEKSGDPSFPFVVGCMFTKRL